MRVLKFPDTHPLANPKDWLQGCQGLLKEDSPERKKTTAHMCGSRVMGQNQGKSNSKRPAQSVPLITIILQPTFMLDLLESQTGPDPATRAI